MKKLFCVFVAAVMALMLTACSPADDGKEDLANTAVPSGNLATSTPDTTPQQSATASAVRTAPSIPVDELVLAPVTRIKVDTDPEALLQALKTAWTEFNNGEMADHAKYLEIANTQANEFNDVTEIKTGNSVSIKIESRFFDDINTGEPVKQVYSITATDTSGLLPIWPSVNIYIIVRTFVCETAADAHALTALLVNNDESKIDTSLLYPMHYKGYRIEMNNRIFEKSRIYVRSADYFDTIVDGARIPLPQPQNLTLTLDNYEGVLAEAHKYIGSQVTTELTVMHVSNGVIYGYITHEDTHWARLRRRVTVSYFENESMVAGFVEGDVVTVTGVLQEARTEAHIGIYNYNIVIAGETAQSAK